jgi:hypothetical protein
MSSKKLLFSAAVLCACAGVASATVTKFAAFHAWGPAGATDCQTSGSCGSVDNPNVDGTGTLRYVPALPSNPQDYTRLHFQVSGLRPNTGYSVLFENDLIGSRTAMTPTGSLVVFTSDATGDGVFTSNDSFLPGDWTLDTGGFGNPRVTIFIWDGVVEESVAVHTGDRDTLDCWHETRAVSVLR